MICARQNLGMSDNCAICKALQPDFYIPCRGEPDKVNLPIKKSQPEIVIVPVRKLSYTDAKQEVEKYIQTKNGKIYISEIVEELRLDIEMVEKIIEELSITPT